MEGRLHIVGVGPGGRQFLTPAAYKVVEDAGVLVGGKNALNLFQEEDKIKYLVDGNIKELPDLIKRELAGNDVAVLVSGDPGIFSLLTYLLKYFPRKKINVVPGISSVQLAFSKMGMPWHDAIIFSLHGRCKEEVLPSILEKVRQNCKLAILMDPRYSPQQLARFLLESGIAAEPKIMLIAEKLCSEQEQIIETGLEKAPFLAGTFENCVVIITGEQSNKDLAQAQGIQPPFYSSEVWQSVTPGIPDRYFTRGKVPMTREEIRSLVMAKARLQYDSCVIDIGSGTGSLAVEAALLAPQGTVYSVEKNNEALGLIRANANKFGLKNLIVVPGEAPEALRNIPQVDRLIIGGSGGKLAEILQVIPKILKPGGRLVMTAVTLETLNMGSSTLAKMKLRDLEVISAAITKAEPVGDFHLWKGSNPVYIICGNF